MELLLKTIDIKKQYGSFWALKGVSLDIYKGEILTLLGANGAGKTTLSCIIASIHPPNSGTILWNNKPIYDDLINYRRSIGFCPQKPNFSNKLSVYEHLKFAGRFLLMPEAVIEQRIVTLVDQFDLKKFIHAKPDILSGGYKQRLLLARALIHNPALVILDEPTVALDPHIRRQLWDYIKTLKVAGTTVLLTTHYLDEAEILSDRVCVLHKGLIQLIDTPSNLMTSYNKARLEDVFLVLMEEETSLGNH